MGEKETNGKRLGFFRSLFDKNRSAASEEPKAESQELQTETAKPKNQDIAIEAAGALLEAWCRWKPGDEPRRLSMLGDGLGCALPLNESELNIERMRLTPKIDRDAKDYLNMLDRYEDKKLQLEAKAALAAAGAGENAETAAEQMPVVKTICNSYVSANGVAAWIMLFPPSENAPALDMATIAAALEENKITTGIDAAVLNKIFQNPVYFTLIPIACGTPVQEGENGRVVEHYPRQLNRSVKLDEKGVADYRAMNYMQLIKEGDVICDIIPPVEGVAGMRVDGTTAAPQPVKAAKVEIGANTALNEDGTKLVAAKEGHLEYDGSKFCVKLILDIPSDVDYNTGNINYNGDVHIRGDVRGTFVVKATGNITIDGLVEAATVEAGGDVLISCGILGDNHAKIKSGGNVRAKYIDNCEVHAAKSVFADCIMSSQVYSDETVQVTSGRGAIIGGTIVAAHSVKSRVVGTEAGRKTEIELGTLTYIKAERGIDSAELKSLMDELAGLERDIAFLVKRQRMIEDEKKEDHRLENALSRKAVVCAQLEGLTARQQELEELRPDLTKCRFESSIVYPPAMLNIGGAIWKCEEVKNSCVGIFNKETGEVKIS